MKFIMLFLLTLSTSAFASDDNLAKKSLKVYQEIEEINKKASAATKKVSEKQSKTYKLKRNLSKKMTAREIEYIEKSIERENKNLEYNRKQIERSTAQIKLNNEILKMNQLPEPQKKAKLVVLESKHQELLKEHQLLSKPFNDKVKQLRKDVEADNKAFSKLMKQYFLLSKSFPEIASVTVNATIHSAFISVHWNDKNDKQLVWAHVRLREKPVINSNSKTLADKYYLSSSSNSSVWVWAGHFQVAFVADKKNFRNETKLQKAVQALVDLEGLAKIKAK
jgi:ATPase subunit of ABC transporter with duplicated ATPase domains